VLGGTFASTNFYPVSQRGVISDQVTGASGTKTFGSCWAADCGTLLAQGYVTLASGKFLGLHFRGTQIWFLPALTLAVSAE
jgi:hypothetical protein